MQDRYATVSFPTFEFQKGSEPLLPPKVSPVPDKSNGMSKFRRRESHCCPSRHHMEGNFKLGQWRLCPDFEVQFNELLNKLSDHWIGLFDLRIDYFDRKAGLPPSTKV